MSAILELGQVKSSSRRDSNVVENDGRAASLALDSRGGISESAASASFQSRREGKSRRGKASEHEQRRNHCG